MKYLLILYAEYNDGKTAKKAMYEENNVIDIEASFYGYVSTYMKDQTVSHLFIEATSTIGMSIAKKVWDRPVEIEE